MMILLQKQHEFTIIGIENDKVCDKQVQVRRFWDNKMYITYLIGKVKSVMSMMILRFYNKINDIILL